MKYKVRYYQDDLYEVYSYWEEYGTIMTQQEFVGSLADCEAWIRLHENGYM